MALQLCGMSVDSIGLIDDDPTVRGMYEMTVDAMDLTAVSQNDPLPDLAAFAEDFTSKADAAICDHNLRSRGYSRYNGAALVATWYKAQFPVVLCTRWHGQSIQELRKWRRWIPALIDSDDLDPDTIADGLVQCSEEFSGLYRPSRKPWRTLVAVEQLDKNGGNTLLSVRISGWDPGKIIAIELGQLPKALRGCVKEGTRFHAKVNLGAETQDMLFFEDWES